jgi:DNA adenine methylase
MPGGPASPFSYPGGKYRLLKHLLPLLTDGNPATFTDVFAGGGSVTLAIAEALPNTLLHMNDLDPFMAAFWTVIANGDDVPELKEKVMAVQPSRQLYDDIRPGQETILDRALAALYQIQTSYSGMSGEGATWSDPSDWNPDNVCRQIDRCRLLLTGRTTVSQLPFGQAPWADRVYFDPPYVAQNKVYRMGGGLWSPEWPEHHDDLMHYLIARDGWVLSYDDHPFIRERYSWATIREIPIGYSFNHHTRGDERSHKTELIITPPNPRPSNLPPTQPPQTPSTRAPRAAADPNPAF